MTNISLRTACAVTSAALALLTAAPLAHAGESPVVIRLYDIATGDPDRRDVAMEIVTAMMADAGIAVDWRDCSAGGDAHPCRTVRDRHDLVVRIVPTPAGRDDTARDRQLGFAAVDPSGQGNVMATIYYERVLRTARRTSLDAGALLGRAMAHEIGHLLLRAPGHSQAGLMRALWTDAELSHNRPDDWRFTDAERRRLRANLQRDDQVGVRAAATPAPHVDESEASSLR